MKSIRLIKLISVFYSILFLRCGIIEALFQPQDDGMEPSVITLPTPIYSEDSIIIQKILDTNNLNFKIHDVAYATANNRVREIIISGSVWDSNSLVDTFIIPEQICRLDSLKELILNYLKMRCLRIPLKASRVPNVHALLLSSNKLKGFPDNLSFFESLDNVHLDYNNIDTLQSFDINCPNIKWLTLENNNLTTIPNDIYLLSNLKGLYLSSNNINNLPLEINLLDSLSVLTIRNNKLCYPSDSLSELLNKFDYAWKPNQNCN